MDEIQSGSHRNNMQTSLLTAVRKALLHTNASKWEVLVGGCDVDKHTQASLDVCYNLIQILALVNIELYIGSCPAIFQASALSTRILILCASAFCSSGVPDDVLQKLAKNGSSDGDSDKAVGASCSGAGDLRTLPSEAWSSIYSRFVVKQEATSHASAAEVRIAASTESCPPV